MTIKRIETAGYVMVPARGINVITGEEDTCRKSLIRAIHGNAVEGIMVENFGDPAYPLTMPLLMSYPQKLALLQAVIRDENFGEGSICVWEFPECMTAPTRYQEIVKGLFQLLDKGVQVFLTTHSYAIVKEIELATTASHSAAYHTLYESDGVVRMETHSEPWKSEHSPIIVAMNDLYDRTIRKALGGLD